MESKSFNKFWMMIFLCLTQAVTSPGQQVASEASLLSKAVSTSGLAAHYTPYRYIHIIGEDENVPKFSDGEFFDMAGSIVFPVGKSDLPQGAPLLQQLATNVIPQLNRDSLQIVSIIFRGAASPEGPVELNQRLGQQRMKALFDFFKNRMTTPVSEDIYSTSSDIEDYPSLCLLMSRANDPDYPRVQTLTDTYYKGNDIPALVQLKQQLQQADGGRLWQRLKATYFPKLRTARFVIVLRKFLPPEMTDIAPADLTQKPEKPVRPDTIVAAVPIVPAVSEPVIEVLPDTLHRRELLSVKTNLLLDLAYMPGYDRWCPIPNIAIEYYPKRGHFTYGASFDMPWWQHYDDHKFFQFRNYQVEARYYVKGSKPYEPYEPYQAPAFKGLYLQGYLHAAIFGICFDANRGWEGEGAGGGIGVGYVMPISRNGHWRLELGLQAGFFRCKYDPYQYENPVDPDDHDNLYYYKWTLEPDLFKKRQYRWNWIGPTRVGITLSYDLLYRRIQKRGASFKNKELRYEE